MEKNPWPIALKTDRIEALCDGVFAIAMTILVFSFENMLIAPQILTEEGFWNTISNLWPDFLHYVMGFLILGTFWVLHHQQFHFIRRIDSRLLFLNIFGLMLVSLIPLTISIAGDYGHMALASVIFETNLFLAGIVFYLHWTLVAEKDRYVDADLDPRIIRYYKKRHLVIPAVSVAAILISLLYPRAGTLLYFFVPLLLLLPRL